MAVVANVSLWTCVFSGLSSVPSQTAVFAVGRGHMMILCTYVIMVECEVRRSFFLCMLPLWNCVFFWSQLSVPSQTAVVAVSRRHMMILCTCVIMVACEVSRSFAFFVHAQSLQLYNTFESSS